MTKSRAWQMWLWSTVLAVALALLVDSDLSDAAWVSKLNQQGSPPPVRDTRSPTGYALGQRQFLGTHERGDTYRWIATTQKQIGSSVLAARTYHADTIPTGRPQLMPKLYALWLAAVSWGGHIITGDSLGSAIERAALWEPVIAHIIAYLAVVGFMWLRFGPSAAGITGIYFALFPPITAQFLPGVLSPRTWALLFATGSLTLHVPRGDHANDRDHGFSVPGAVAAGVALWLDPALGFPAVIVAVAVGAGAILVRHPLPFLRWSLIGAAITTAAWLFDRLPWNPSAGELRYVHPLYAVAWLGFGLALDSGQSLRVRGPRRFVPIMKGTAGLLLVSALLYTQLRYDYKGWLYPSAAMERLTSLDETTVFSGAFAWFRHASLSERWFLAAPAATALIVLAAGWQQKCRTRARIVPVTAVVFIGVVVLAWFRIRWAIGVALVAPVVVCSQLEILSDLGRRTMGVGSAILVIALAAWGLSPPPSLLRPSGAAEPKVADLNALIYRHFAHWLTTHHPGQKINALAPPELSDSLVFHGGSHVLMSTAWESYPGQVAASRILSAPEATEAEAMLQSREITHVILPSWDEVLPLLVRKPPEPDKTALYERLQRWVYPPYLRPIPYHLPSVPGYLGQKLVVFKVVPPQDEALSLSRLAEYFVEMDREQPATLAAKVLAESFPNDPNAAIARAIVYAQVHDRARFEAELGRLTADASKPESLAWDRRVQRAIVLALGKQYPLERSEINACVAEASSDVLLDLTPLQAYRLCTLARENGMTFKDPALAQLAETLGAEYRAGPAPASRR